MAMILHSPTPRRTLESNQTKSWLPLLLGSPGITSPEPFLQSAHQVSRAEGGTVLMTSCCRIWVFCRIWPKTCFQGHMLSHSKVMGKKKQEPHTPTCAPPEAIIFTK